MNRKETDIMMRKEVLNVVFTGHKYILLAEKGPEYNVGEMICECERVDTAVVKNSILKLSVYENPISQDTVTLALEELKTVLYEKLGICSGQIIITELCNRLNELLKHRDCIDNNDFWEAHDISMDVLIKAMKNEGFEGAGFESVGQLFVSGFVLFSVFWNKFKELYRLVMPSLVEGASPLRRKHVIETMFETIIFAQDIDYKIMNIEDGLKNVYGIKNTISFLSFEYANCLNLDIHVRKCENCGMYFVVSGRSDKIYCSYSAPQNHEKTCREIGPQLKRAEKEKTDEPTKEYRKLYMRIKMQAKRHPDDTELQERLNRMVSENRDMRTKLKFGMITNKQYFEWLKQFE